MSSLQVAIERLATLGEVEQNPDARKTFLEFREQLTKGEIRAAEKIDWPFTRLKVNAWRTQTNFDLAVDLSAVAGDYSGANFDADLCECAASGGAACGSAE